MYPQCDVVFQNCFDKVLEETIRWYEWPPNNVKGHIAVMAPLSGNFSEICICGETREEGHVGTRTQLHTHVMTPVGQS